MTLFPGSTRPRFLVRRVGFLEEPALRRFLATDPDSNAFLLGWDDECGLVPQWPDQHFEVVAATRSSDDVVASTLFAGPGMACLSAGAPDAAEALGRDCAQRARPLRTLVGPREVTEAFARGVGASDATTIIPQSLLTLSPRELRYFPEPLLVEATALDREEVEETSVRMYTEEMGPLARDEDLPLVRRSAAQRVLLGRTVLVRHPVDGKLLFKASVMSRCPRAVQIEGVWVRPELRGRGLARRALSELCRRLLTEADRVTLYVNDGNEPALRLYARLGFRVHCPWATILLGRE